MVHFCFTYQDQNYSFFELAFMYMIHIGGILLEYRWNKIHLVVLREGKNY